MGNVLLERIAAIGEKDVFAPFLSDNYDAYSNGAVLPAGQRPLSAEWISENRTLAGIEAEVEPELARFAAFVDGDETLRFLFFHCARLLYGLNQLYPTDKIIAWPESIDLLPEGETSKFQLLLGFHAIDRIKAVHMTMGIDSAITAATCADVGSRVLISKEFDNGKIGISANCLNWLRHHAKGKLFQIGRLQFHLVQFAKNFIAYQHKTRRECKIVAEPGYRFTSEGLFDGTGFKSFVDSWVSEYNESDGIITANVVDTSSGKLKREPESFSLSEWIPVVNHDSLVMNTHIPRGPRMTLESWFDSISAGFAFFESRTPPEITLKAAACFSWMFEPRLQDMLPETSGLVKLQKAVNLFPRLSTSTTCGMYFIFGKNEVDINSVPTDTSLRKAVVEHVKNGGILTGGAMLLLKDQLQQ